MSYGHTIRRKRVWYVREASGQGFLFSDTDKAKATAAHRLFTALGHGLRPLSYAMEPLS